MEWAGHPALRDETRGDETGDKIYCYRDHSLAALCRVGIIFMAVTGPIPLTST